MGEHVKSGTSEDNSTAEDGLSVTITFRHYTIRSRAG